MAGGLIHWYGCLWGHHLATVREGWGRAWDCALGPEVGGRQYVFPFYISW